MKRMLQAIWARSPSDEPQLQMPEEIVFPLQTVEQMAAFDELLEDKAKMSSVVRI